MLLLFRLFSIIRLTYYLFDSEETKQNSFLQLKQAKKMMIFDFSLHPSIHQHTTFKRIFSQKKSSKKIMPTPDLKVKQSWHKRYRHLFKIGRRKNLKIVVVDIIIVIIVESSSTLSSLFSNGYCFHILNEWMNIILSSCNNHHENQKSKNYIHTMDYINFCRFSS